MKNIRNFYLKFFIFLVGKFSVYLNRHVFVMVQIFFSRTKKALRLDLGIKHQGFKVSETAGPIFFKFHVESCIKGGLKICKWSRSVK